MFYGCGKRKLPSPPVERIQQRTEISGGQKGDAVLLEWKMPVRNASEGNTLNISRIDIYRLIEPLDAPLVLSEEEFASRSTVISSVNVGENDFGLQNLSYTDRLEFSGQPARLRYAIRFVNSSGQKAAFSNFLLIEPSAKIAESPRNLKAEVSQNKIALEWLEPARNVDGTAPANVLGYNVYRLSASEQTPRKLNPTPIADSNFEDNFFEFKIQYKYFVRAVSLGGESQPVESLDSDTITVLPEDIFPPAPPEGITVAASPGRISIFFATNVEKDIAGYRIYRSENRNLPKTEWKLLTDDLLKTNTFQDSTVETGVEYFYFLTAVDNFGNVSEPSETVSEKAF